MKARYALRFENGERAGETVPFDASGMTLGRRPGNTIQVLESSVSGRHAEIVVGEDGATIRDLKSTNGTRVGSRRIAEQRLAQGDRIYLGSLELTFLDLALEPAAAADSTAPDSPAAEDPVPLEPPAASPSSRTLVDIAPAGEVLQHVSTERLARVSRRSVGSAIAVVAIAAGVTAGVLLLRGSRAAERESGPPVVPVEGDLLAADYSFEGEAPGWSADPRGPAEFLPDPDARTSGELGLMAGVAAQEWARHASSALTAISGRRLELRGLLSVEGEARGRLGLRFSHSTGRSPATTAWSAPRGGDGGGFEQVVLGCAVPPGYDTVEAFVLAEAEPDAQVGGRVSVDDVSLVPSGSAGEPAASLEEMQLSLLGEPAWSAALFEIDRNPLVDLAWIDRRASVPSGEGRLSVRPREDGFEILLDPLRSGPEHRLGLRVDGATAAAGLATTGEGGYRTHALDLDRAGVQSLLLGAGQDLLRLRFDTPAGVRARPDEDGLRVEVDLAGATSFILQLAFGAERAEAASLAHRARGAAEEGRLGESLALWGELLDSYPFEAQLVQEAEQNRAELTGAGLRNLQQVRQEVERARFFELAGIFRQCRRGAEDVAARFAGSEVERAAREEIGRIDADLERLAAGRGHDELERLEAIRSALDAANMPELASAVGAGLERRRALDTPETREEH